MGIIDDAEMGFSGSPRREERVDAGILFIPDYMHVVTIVVHDPVGTYPVVVPGIGLQTSDTHPHHPVVQVRDTVSAAFDLHGIAQVRFLSIEDIAVGQVADSEHDTYGI